MKGKIGKRNTRIGTIIPVLAMLAAVTASRLVAPQSQNQSSQNVQSRQQLTTQIDENSLPVVEYDASERLSQIDPATRAKKSKRYNGRHLKDSDSSQLSVVTSHWLLKLPAIPVTISDAVLVGDIVDARAFLSEDKAGVYSEFTLQIENILKDSGHIPLALNDFLAVDREGGRVKFPSGHIRTLIAEYQGIPLVGHKYLFFLKRNDDEPNNLILTAYEVSNGKVFAVDGRALRDGQLLSQFAPYDGTDFERFLSEVRSAIAREPMQISNRQE